MVENEDDEEDYAIELPVDENLLDQQGDPPNDGSEIDDIGKSMMTWMCSMKRLSRCRLFGDTALHLLMVA